MMTATVLPFRSPDKAADPLALAFAPGVPPFDRSDPNHVRAWNTMMTLAASHTRFLERSGYTE